MVLVSYSSQIPGAISYEQTFQQSPRKWKCNKELWTNMTYVLQTKLISKVNKCNLWKCNICGKMQCHLCKIKFIIFKIISKITIWVILKYWTGIKLNWHNFLLEQCETRINSKYFCPNTKYSWNKKISTPL